MSRYPHSKLFTGPVRCLVLSGPHLQVIDPKTGVILHTSTKFSDQEKDALIKSGPIRCSALNHSGKYLASVGDDKKLKIWDLDSLVLLSARELPKKPTCIEFSKGDDLIVSDKFGDVFRYPFNPRNAPITEDKKNTLYASHENPSGGELILGHTSLLTSCLLTPDEQFVITADRDEHIRVSWYPQGYTIESYCLGHEKYVSAIHIPQFSPATLISGGGDPELKLWDWMTGRLERNVHIFSAVEPFIKVKVRKRGHRTHEDAQEGDEAAKGKARRRSKGKERQDSATGNEGDEPGLVRPSPSEISSQVSAATETVLVVRKISSFVSESENVIVFSVVGSTAIFVFTLPGSDNHPRIHHFDFRKPLIDFTIADGNWIWALLDADYHEGDDIAAQNESKLIRLIRWSTSEFLELDNSPLLDSLNSKCVLSASTEDLKTLDLYSDLSSLPKNTDVEAERQGEDKLPQGPQDTLLDHSAATGASDQGSTKRTLGRLKHKRALEKLQQGQTDSVDSVPPGSKRQKSEAGEMATEDADMEVT
ncbi:WD40-repeat-containing domain protein [Phlebopus sp. FC_14]|nr:WD40-repeat-containing domain protein [Phlebopus sp. FC_14]